MKRKPADHLIVAIHVTNRVRQAVRVQQVLTQYGANIKTRLGLHEATGKSVSPNGVILLEMVGPVQRCLGIITTLNHIGGVEAKSVSFGH